MIYNKEEANRNQYNPNAASQNAEQNLKLKLQADLHKNNQPQQIQGALNIEEENQKQRNSLGRISTVILRGNPDEQFVPSPTIKKKKQPVNPYSGAFSDVATKEDNHSRLIKYLKEQKRTKHAAEFLIEQFSEFRFFKQIMRQLSEDLLKQIIFELKLETYKKHQIIFQYNDVGRHMYFILSGKVAILIPSKPNNPTSEVNTPTQKQTPVANDSNLNIINQQNSLQQQQSQQGSATQINSGTNSVPVSPRIQVQPVPQSPFAQAVNQVHSSSNQIVSNFRDYLIKMVGLSQIEHLTDEEEFEYFRQFKLPYFKQVNTVSAGNSFGEVALEQRIPRTASTVTITPCQLATLSYDSFRKLLSKIYERIQNEQRSFLKEIPPFNNWPNAGIMVIYNNSEEVEYQINNIIYKEGDRCQYVYFIKEGEIEISKVFKIDKCDTNTLQKKNILTKRQVIQRVAQGRMFGEYEGILHLLDPKKKNNILFNTKQKEALPLRETQAICQTKVKLMRIDSRLFFLNFWAFNNPEDQEFFSIQRRNMLDKINKIQNLIDNFQNTNIQNQEINELSEMLQTNSMLQQHHEIKKLMRGSISTPKQKYSICTTTPINLLSPHSNKKLEIQLNNNSKNNKSNDTASSERTTILGSPMTNNTMKRSSSINFNINISPNSASGAGMSYFSSSNQPLASPSLIQAAQQNQLLKQPSLFQRLNKIQNSIFEASSPISGRGSEPFTNFDSFSKYNNNQQEQLSPRKSTGQLQIPQRSSQKKNTYSHVSYSPNSPNINSIMQTPMTQRNSTNLMLSDIHSPNSQFTKHNQKQQPQEFQPSYPEQLDLNDTKSAPNLDGQNHQQSSNIENNNHKQNPNQQNLNQQQQNLSPTRSLQQLNKEQQPIKSAVSLSRQKTHDHQMRGDSEQSHQKANKKEQQVLLLDQPLKIFQLKDSRKLKVLKKDIEDKFQQWRDQDKGKKIIRKKKSLSIKFNNQTSSIINQIQHQLSSKNQEFDQRFMKQFQEGQNKFNSPQTERQELRKQMDNNDSNDPSLTSHSATNLKLAFNHDQKIALFKSAQFNSENPSDFINILRKNRRNPSAVFTASSKKQLIEEDNSNYLEKQNNSMNTNSHHQIQNEISSPTLITQFTHTLKKEVLSPMKIISMTQEKPVIHHLDSPQIGSMQTPHSPNFTIRPLLSPQSHSQNKDNKFNKSGQNIYKFQIVQKQIEEEQTMRRLVQTQQSSRKKVVQSTKIIGNQDDMAQIGLETRNSQNDLLQQQRQQYIKNRFQNSKSLSIMNFESLKSIQSPSKNFNNVQNNGQTSIAEITQHQTEISQPTLVNIQHNSKKEHLPIQTLAYLDQSPLKLKSSGLFSNGQVMRSCSQPNILNCMQPIQESLISSSIMKDEKLMPQQIQQGLIQPMHCIQNNNHIKKNINTKQVITLEQASKLPPTIKISNSDMTKRFQKGMTFSIPNFDVRENKQIGSQRNLDMDSQFINGQQMQSMKQFKTHTKIQAE